MRRVWVGVVLLMCAVLLAGGTIVLAADTVKLGVVEPLTGSLKSFGDQIQKGMMMSQDEFNAKGGFTKGPLAGKQLELVFVDNESTKGKSAAIAEQFVTVDKYPIILGGYSSTDVLEIGPVAEKTGVPYLTNSGATDKLSQMGIKSVFRMNPTSTQYIAGLDDFLTNVVKPKTVAILYEDTDYGKSTSASMRTFCQKAGLQVVFDEAYAAKSPDYNVMLLKMKATNPDVVFMVSYLMDAILLTKQAKELGIKPKIFAGGAAGFVMPEYPVQAGAAAENVITADLWAPDVKYAGAKEFAAAFRTRYNMEASYHGAQAYAVIKVVVDVLERAASLSPADISAALKATDMATIFAPVQFGDFENYTNQNRVPTLVRQVQKGKMVTVWPKEIAEFPYVYPLPE